MFTPPSTNGLKAYISTCTKNFVGREWVFQEIHHWLTHEDSRFFLILGRPGCGKTTLSARLLDFQYGKEACSEDAPSIRPGFLSGAHFCRVQDYHLISPYSFSQGLADQLGDHPTFGEFFKQRLGERNAGTPLAHVTQNVGTVSDHGQAIALSIKKLDLSGLSSEDAFDRFVHAPLKDTLENEAFKDTPVIILVDGLDEALQIRRDVNIVELLGSLKYLPDNVRFIVTSSRMSAVSERLQADTEQTHVLALDDEDKSRSDVREFLEDQLQKTPELSKLIGQDCSKEELITGIERKAQANFLFLKHLLSQLERLDGPIKLSALTVPESLNRVYYVHLENMERRARDHWADNLRILGLLAVAQEMLPETLLARLARMNQSDLRNQTRLYESLLNIEVLPENKQEERDRVRHYNLYHPSFGQYLQDSERAGAFWRKAAEQHATIASQLTAQYCDSWEQADDYSLKYTPTHYVSAVEGFKPSPERDQLVTQLLDVVLDPSYQAAHCQRVNNVATLRNLQLLALECAADGASLNSGQALINVVRAALAFEPFRQKYLQLAQTFELAAVGNLTIAFDRLRLQLMDQQWLDAATLLLCWIAHEAAPAACNVILAEYKENLSTQEPILARLMQRVLADIDPEKAPQLPPLPEPLEAAQMDELARAIVKRMGGLQQSGIDIQELCSKVLATVKTGMATFGGSGRQVDSVFVSTEDGPVLLSYLQQRPEAGQTYFDQYLQIHATTPDLYYREESMWRLLEWILLHPDAGWVKKTMRQIFVDVLAGRERSFTEGVAITKSALAAQFNPAEARATFEELRVQLLLDAAEAGISTQLDEWGFHGRRLASLAEVLACLRNPIDSNWKRFPTLLISHAINLVTHQKGQSFAGYRVFANLQLAETTYISRLDGQLPIDDRLEEARKAAHNIRHPSFCARMTARLNTIKQWWQEARAGAIDLEEAIKTLVDTSAVRKGLVYKREIAARHYIGEDFEHRASGRETLPAHFYTACCLRDLQKMFGFSEKDLARLLELNQEIVDDPDEQIPPDATIVYIPDADLYALRAVWLSALVLADQTLGLDAQARYIRSLVPCTITSPTALDTILSRLLIAVQPMEQWLWDELDSII